MLPYPDYPPSPSGSSVATSCGIPQQGGLILASTLGVHRSVGLQEGPQMTESR